MCGQSLVDSTISTEKNHVENSGSKLSSTSDDVSQISKAHQTLEKGTLYVCLSVVILVTGAAVTFPLLQGRRDDLGCDSFCYGSMTSTRSALTLIGTAVIGRLSDKNNTILARTLGSFGKDKSSSGRRGCLHLGIAASLVGLGISVSMNSLRGLWLSMIPSALLQHNFDICKSLLSEYHNDIEQLETQNEEHIEENTDDEKRDNSEKSNSSRSGSVGKLGMSAGISFMIGPMIASLTTPTFFQAAYFAIFCTIASWLVILQIPLPAQKIISESNKHNDNDNNTQKKQTEFTLMNLLKFKTHKSRAAMFLLVIRLNMALAFHIFNTVWPASLKSRFQGSFDYARFMSFIGITYAFSQGFLAKRLVNLFGKDGKSYMLIMVCCAVLGAGRYIAFYTDSIYVIYLSFLFVINALGTLNTIITADTGSIAPKDEVGSLFGILQAAESAAGMIGPMIGGIISHKFGDDAPLLGCVGVYAFLFAFTSWGYQRYVVSSSSEKDSKKSN